MAEFTNKERHHIDALRQRLDFIREEMRQQGAALGRLMTRVAELEKEFEDEE